MEFDEIVVKESPGLCRCCLSEGCYKDLGSEYTWMNDTEVYADMLLECFDISISQHNDGPNGANRLICEVCITRLRDACNFKKQVLDSEKKFIDMVARGEFRPKVLVYQTQTMKPEPTNEEQHRQENEIEYLEDEMDFGDDEPLKQIQALDEVTEDPTVSEDIMVATLPVKGKRGRPRKSDTPAKPERKAKVPKLEEKPRSSKAIVKEINSNTLSVPVTSAAMRRRQNLVTIFNNTSIIPFKSRGKHECFYCNSKYVLYEEFVKHTKSHGSCTVTHEALKNQKRGYIEVKLDVSKIICELCHSAWPSFDGIVNHLIESHNLTYDKDVDMNVTAYSLKDLKCLICGQVFEYFRYLAGHVNKQHPIKSLPCKFCDKTFNKKMDLHAHITTNHRFDGHSCGICKRRLTTKESLIAHITEQHVTTCHVCLEKFSSEIDKLEHVHTCHSTDDLNLETTDEHNAVENQSSESRRSEFAISNKIAQKNRENVACVLQNTTAIPFRFFKSKFTCFYCNMGFRRPIEMREHTVKQHLSYDITQKLPRPLTGSVIYIKLDISSLSCKLCYEPFDDFNSMINHLVDSHKTNYDKSVMTINWHPYKVDEHFTPCPHCGEMFQRFHILIRHMHAKHLPKNCLCTQCGTCFTNSSSLKVHMNMMHGTYKCELCNMECDNKRKLQRHLAKIHGTKEISCSICSKKFTFEYYLRKHKLSAHNIGFKCIYCRKMFITAYFLNKHVTHTHKKERNFECTVCNKKFLEKVVLKRHMATHADLREFKCDICGLDFNWKKNLRVHIQCHNKGSIKIPKLRKPVK